MCTKKSSLNYMKVYAFVGGKVEKSLKSLSDNFFDIAKNLEERRQNTEYSVKVAERFVRRYDEKSDEKSNPLKDFAIKTLDFTEDKLIDLAEKVENLKNKLQGNSDKTETEKKNFFKSLKDGLSSFGGTVQKQATKAAETLVDAYLETVNTTTSCINATQSYIVSKNAESKLNRLTKKFESRERKNKSNLDKLNKIKTQIDDIKASGVIKNDSNDLKQKKFSFSLFRTSVDELTVA